MTATQPSCPLLILVTARGGSKGLPGKNLSSLAGRPLVRWAFEVARPLLSALPHARLRLSTDDPEIAAAWPDSHRPCTLRPGHLATDTAASMDVVLHELDAQPADAVLLLQPTAPLLRADDLTALLRAHAASPDASVLAVTELDHPIEWSLRRAEDGRLSPAADWTDAPRQASQPAWRPVGAYLATAAFLRQHRAFLVPGKSVGVAVPRSRGIDIDTAADLEIARALLAIDRGERTIDLGGRAIGEGCPALVIAEAGVNHNGDIGRALELVDAAADAGADAVKFQTFRADALATRDAGMAAYQKRNTASERTQREMLAALELGEADFRRLKEHAEARGLVFLSSPFDEASAALLAGLGVAAFKLGSGELTNDPLLASVARAGRPMLLSTGMATLEECEHAAATVRGAGAPPVCWLHCVSSYPAPAEASNLRAMHSLRAALGGPVGLSDHTMGWEVTLAAVAMGARVIEKHFTLSRALPGPDHAASLEPGEFAQMMRQVRTVEAALGDGVKRPAECELDTMRAARKSLVAAADLEAGTVLTAASLAAKRPGTGLPPTLRGEIIGRTLRRRIAADEPISMDDLA